MNENKLQLRFLIISILVVLCLLLATQFLGNVPILFGSASWHGSASVGWVT